MMTSLKMVLVLFSVLALPLSASTQLLNNAFGVRNMTMADATLTNGIFADAIGVNSASISPYSQFNSQLESGSIFGGQYIAVTGQHAAILPAVRWGYFQFSDTGIPAAQLNDRGHPEYTGRHFDYRLQHAQLAWPLSIDNVLTSTRLNWVHQSADTHTSHGFSLDVNSLLLFPWDKNTLAFGAAAHNLLQSGVNWTTEKSERLPQKLMGSVGLFETLTRSWSIEATARYFRLPAEPKAKQWLSSSFGVEYWALGHPTTTAGVAIRGGYHAQYWSIGGVVQWQGLSIDFGTQSFHDGYRPIAFRSSIGLNLSPRVPIPAAAPQDIKWPSMASPEFNFDTVPQVTSLMVPPPRQMPPSKMALPPHDKLLLDATFDIQLHHSQWVATLTPIHAPKTARFNHAPWPTQPQLFNPMQTAHLLIPARDSQVVILTLFINENGHMVISGNAPPSLNFLINGTWVSPSFNGDFYYKVGLPFAKNSLNFSIIR